MLKARVQINPQGMHERKNNPLPARAKNVAWYQPRSSHLVRLVLVVYPKEVDRLLTVVRKLLTRPLRLGASSARRRSRQQKRGAALLRVARGRNMSGSSGSLVVVDCSGVAPGNITHRKLQRSVLTKKGQEEHRKEPQPGHLCAHDGEQKPHRPSDENDPLRANKWGAIHSAQNFGIID